MIRKIIAGYHLDEMIGRIIGQVVIPVLLSLDHVHKKYETIK